MRLNQLEYLVALHEHGSILKASQHLFVSQPTISSAIKELEQELGCAMIERSNKGSVVTKKGLEILDSTRIIMRELGRIREIAAEETRREVLSIAGPTHLCSIVLTKVNMMLYDLLPHRICDLRVGNSIVLMEQLLRRELDYAVVYMDSVLEKHYEAAIKDGVIFDVLFKDPLAITSRPNHPLTGREVALQEIFKYPFASLYSIQNSAFLRFLRENGYTSSVQKILEPSSIRKVANSTDTLISMSETTMHVGNMLYADPLVAINLPEYNRILTVALAYREPHIPEVKESIQKAIADSNLFAS